MSVGREPCGPRPTLVAALSVSNDDEAIETLGLSVTSVVSAAVGPRNPVRVWDVEGVRDVGCQREPVATTFADGDRLPVPERADLHHVLVLRLSAAERAGVGGLPIGGCVRGDAIFGVLVIRRGV